MQRGYLLFELVLVLAIGCLAAVWGADAWRREADAVAGRAAGAWLLEIRGALARMMARHQDDLVQGLPPQLAAGGPAYADPRAPRLDELIRHGHLPAGFPEVAAGGLRVALRILRHPSCPGAGCRLDGLAYSLAPPGATAASGALNSPAADPSLLAAVLAATDGYGGHVDGQTPDLLRGPNFRFPNPPAADMPRLAVGTVAVWAGSNPADTSQFLRLRDPRDPNFQGDITAAGQVHAKEGLSTGGYLYLGARARAGDACAPNGLLARSDDGTPLSCARDAWIALGGFGGAYVIETAGACSRFDRTANKNNFREDARPSEDQCGCPAGYIAYVLSPGNPEDTFHRGTVYMCVR